jgi:nucleotide-binding universal stress UspA family protein
MTLLVGYAPDGRGRAVLHLAGMLARSTGDDVLMCAVVSEPWPPSPARVDAEYQTHVRRAAEDALERGRARLAGDVPVTTLIHRARSAPAGLLEVAEERGASVIVAGSAAAGGAGHVALGSTTSRLLHSSHVPVALAPRGYRAAADARVARVTAAFAGTDHELVLAAAEVAARTGAALRVASFVVHARAPYTSGVGREADDSMVDEWTAGVRDAQRGALARVRELAVVPEECEAVVGHGEDWDEALEDLEWEDGDVLVVGSSSIGPLARVFLGSRANKIVRHSPVPAVVVPRRVVAELADEATSGAAAAGDAGEHLADDAVGDQR